MRILRVISPSRISFWPLKCGYESWRFKRPCSYWLIVNVFTVQVFLEPSIINGSVTRDAFYKITKINCQKLTRNRAYAWTVETYLASVLYVSNTQKLIKTIPRHRRKTQRPNSILKHRYRPQSQNYVRPRPCRGLPGIELFDRSAHSKGVYLLTCGVPRPFRWANNPPPHTLDIMFPIYPSSLLSANDDLGLHFAKIFSPINLILL